MRQKQPKCFIKDAARLVVSPFHVIPAEVESLTNGFTNWQLGLFYPQAQEEVLAS
jgi:hypothetical protein